VLQVLSVGTVRCSELLAVVVFSRLFSVTHHKGRLIGGSERRESTEEGARRGESTEENGHSNLLPFFG
jgi:hypothetical protein